MQDANECFRSHPVIRRSTDISDVLIMPMGCREVKNTVKGVRATGKSRNPDLIPPDISAFALVEVMSVFMLVTSQNQQEIKC